jgi:hypothetical protein
MRRVRARLNARLNRARLATLQFHPPMMELDDWGVPRKRIRTHKKDKWRAPTPYKAKQNWAKERLQELSNGQHNSGQEVTKAERKKYAQSFANKKEETRWKLY